jgi:hypothetical protein
VHGLHQREKAHVEGKDLVFGVVDDPGDLVGMQPWIDGVQHAAGARDAVVQLQVAIAVPGNGGHAIGHRQALRVQRVGHLASPARDGGPGAAVDVASTRRETISASP